MPESLENPRSFVKNASQAVRLAVAMCTTLIA